MLLGMKVSSNRFKCREKPLRLPWRFEASHSSLSDSSGLTGILAKVVQPFVLSMLYVLHHLLLRRFVTLEFIRDDDSWHEALFFEEFAKESLCRLRIPMPLQQDFQDFPLRIHCSPQVVLLLFERHHFIQMPFISDEQTFPAKLIGVLLPEFLAPFSNRFI